jgi:hypothetical protein
MSNKQFMAWVGIILAILFFALATERWVQCQEKGGGYCHVGMRGTWR